MSFTLFRISGIDVRVHWSFALILAYGAFIYSDIGSTPLAGALYGLLVITLLFVCVTLHEFGHAIAAQRYGIKVPTITLLPIGGLASMERMPEKPWQEFVIAVAGPLVNVALALVLGPIALAVSGLSMSSLSNLTSFEGWLRSAGQPSAGGLLLYLTAMNLMLALFNLIPAFPMDGGRILRSLLALYMPYVRATRTAVLIGRAIAVLLAIAGLMGGGVMLLLVAFFVYVGGGAERESVEVRSVLRNVKVRSALTHGYVKLYTSERLQRCVDLIMTSYQTDYPVFDLANRFVGVLTRPRLVEALREVGPEGRVVDVMHPAVDVLVVGLDETLADVWEKMALSGSHAVAVKDGAEFCGLLTLHDITEVLHVVGAAMERSAQQSPPPPQADSDHSTPGAVDQV